MHYSINIAVGQKNLALRKAIASYNTFGPWLLIFISTNKKNITEIEKNIMQLDDRLLCILKIGHMPKKVEKYWCIQTVSNGILR